jgi:hypothetical protein
MPENTDLQECLQQQLIRRAELKKAGLNGVAWQKMVDLLAERPEVRVWMHDVWSKREHRFGSASELAEFLLLREFIRRPPRANAPETMGLARLRFDDIDRIPDVLTPTEWLELGFRAEDWRDFLYLLITFIARGRSAVRVPRDVLHWIPPKAISRELMFRPDRRLQSFEVRWPQYGTGALGRLPMVVALLEQVSGRSLDDLNDRGIFNTVFEKAWQALQPLLAKSGATNRQVDFKRAHIAPLATGYFCPIMRRALDIAFRGFSPYGAKIRGSQPVPVTKITLPQHPMPFRGEMNEIPPAEARAIIQSWLDEDTAIAWLRQRGGWSDVADRIAHFSDYFRSAEHSAQQPPAKLRHYESEFKAGAINVLNCSTTMEMGVDIGSVSHVMMTNLPPSIANYRQRVGRAGRRGQPLSLAFTFCRDRPLEREAFRNPIGYLGRQLAPPSVALQSTVIVQRHINALLFAAFVRDRGADALKMETGPFFGCPAEVGAAAPADNPATRLVGWVRDPETASRFAASLLRLTRGSLLEGDTGVCEAAAQAFERTRQGFADEWGAIQSLAASNSGDKPAADNMAIQLKRLCGGYLLGFLAERGVLPSHGFPTDVVSFISRQDPPSDGEDRTEERSRFNAFPQRSLDMAIREYAPGSEVVQDGLVHKSAGVTLNWRRPADPNGVREVQAIKVRWRCRRCGESGIVSNFDSEHPDCPVCHAATVDWWEYLQPAGFASDLREKPHADADLITYVPAEPPTVSARGAEWIALFDPSRGRRRADPDGSVFFCNAGLDGQGFGICLYCGRANHDRTRPHAPLIGKGADCEGHRKPFARKDGLRLGYEIRTDVFEFQPAAWPERGGALALAIALREALAQKLGVESDEMGIAAEPRLDALGTQTVSVFLHDKASGGAGFSVKAHEFFADLIREVEAILDCKVEGCQKGCPACVLIGDLSDEEVGRLDRRPALALVRERLLADGRPEAEDCITPDTRFSVDLLAEIRQALENGGTRLVLYLGGALEAGSLSTWRGAELASHWAGRGRSVVIAVDQGAIDALDGAQRLQLRDLVNRWGVRLEEGRRITFANSATLVAEVTQPNGALLFASRDEGVWRGDIGWGLPTTAPIVRFHGASTWKGTGVAADRLKEPPGVSLRNIKAEIDGSISTFGDRCAALLQSLLGQIGVSPTDRVASLAYEDRYLRSPAVVRLCLDTFGKLANGGTGSVPLVIRTFPLEISSQPQHWLSSDWSREDDRRTVAIAYAKSRGLVLDLQLTRPEHGRRLTLQFVSGRKVEIVLDQGFGAWRSDRGVGFDFSRPAQEQARRLSAVQCGVRLPPGARTYIVVEAKS